MTQEKASIEKAVKQWVSGLVGFRHLSAGDVESLMELLLPLLTTAVKEARAEVWREAIEIVRATWVLVPAESENQPLEAERWKGFNLAAKEIRAKLEAASKQKE